jgi:hypothetical protein
MAIKEQKSLVIQEGQTLKIEKVSVPTLVEAQDVLVKVENMQFELADIGRWKPRRRILPIGSTSSSNSQDLGKLLVVTSLAQLSMPKTPLLSANAYFTFRWPSHIRSLPSFTEDLKLEMVPIRNMSRSIKT